MVIGSSVIFSANGGGLERDWERIERLNDMTGSGTRTGTEEQLHGGGIGNDSFKLGFGIGIGSGFGVADFLVWFWFLGEERGYDRGKIRVLWRNFLKL